MRWAVYKRISDGDQADRYSLEAQSLAAERFVAERNGVIVAVYEDHSSARKVAGRSEFQTMIDDAHRGRFDAIVVHKYDRFARNRRDAVVYKALLKQIGIRVYSVLEPTDPESPTSILFEGMLEVFAEFYSANLGQEVRKGLSVRASNGLHCGCPAYGYTMQDGQLIPNDALASVKLALESYLSGTVTDMDIVRMLNSDGPSMRKPNGTLGRFTRDSIRYILTNPIYAGYIRHNGELIRGHHQAIISLDQHYAILELRARFYHAPRENRRSAREYPFSRIVRCGRCGGAMSSSSTRTGQHEHMTYRCSDRSSGKSACDQPAVRASVVEAAAATVFRDLRVPAALVDRARGLTDDAREARFIAAKRESITTRLRRARAMYLADDMTEGEWQQEKTRAETEMARLPEPPQSTSWISLELGQPIPIWELWQIARGAEQKALARLLLDRIVVDGRAVVEIALSPLGQTLS